MATGSAVQQHIFDEEMALAGAPPPIPFGLTMVAPVIMRFGSPAQQKRFLPRILAMDDWWCQGYSEPQSGSDLASLKTRAVRDGDHYVVNGQKTWTTLAEYADWIFCLVRTRTDGKPQAGISFLLVDMKTPGLASSVRRTPRPSRRPTSTSARRPSTAAPTRSSETSSPTRSSGPWEPDMDFEFTEEQTHLAEAVRKFMTARYGSDRGVRGTYLNSERTGPAGNEALGDP